MNLFRKKKILVPILLGFSIVLLLSCVKSNNASSESSQPALISQSSQSPRFGIPVDCTLGKDCFIMLYADRDPGLNAIDFGCGRQTYDGHKGTDFAISNLNETVPVIAVADGTVERVRDGMSDRLIANDADRAAIKGQECGNGVVISHGEGWETQYCHLRNGSVTVTPGDTVKKGDTLGTIGASGKSSFPHVHLNVTYQKNIVDPFVGVNAEPGCKQQQLQPLWDRSLAYTPTGNIRSGFSASPPQLPELWQGQFKESSFADNVPAIVFWIHNYGVLQGDEEYFKLIAPDGSVAVETENTIDRSRKDWLSFVGQRNNPQAPLAKGIWRSEYQLKRGNNVIIDLNNQATVK